MQLDLLKQVNQEHLERSGPDRALEGRINSFELAYLCSIYSNLLVNKQPMDFYYKPAVGGFANNVMRVSPDILPPGRVKIDSVTIEGQPHRAFDANALTVQLPAERVRPTVKVRIVPT